MTKTEKLIELNREGNFILTMLDDILDVLDNQEYLTQEQIEETLEQKRKLKLRLFKIKTEILFLESK